jgi:general secretion pathway protein L
MTRWVMPLKATTSARALRHFMEWWFDHVRQSVPPVIGDLVQRKTDRLVLRLQGAELLASLTSRKASYQLGRFPVDERGMSELSAAVRQIVQAAPECRIECPASIVLIKRLALPLATSRNLDAVLAFEMDNETPFTLDDVYWSYVVAGKDQTRKELNVDLIVVARQALSRLIQLARNAGLEPTYLDLAYHGQTQAVAIDRGRPVATHGWARSTIGVLRPLCAGLAVAAVMLPFWLQQRAIDRADQRIEALKSKSERALELKRTLNDVGDAARLLQEGRGRSVTPLTVFAALTAAIPDDTYLTELSLRGGHSTASGKSRSAAKLIPALERAPLFQSPSFTAPVVDESDGLETFSLSFDLRQRSGP